jgi:hypothetical protein
MTSTTDRPTGVTAMAVVAGIAGAADILAGLGDIGMGGGFLGDLGFGATFDAIMTGVGLVLVAVGALGLATAFGLWRGRNWAWLIARLWASLCIIVGIVGVALSLLSDRIVTEILAAMIGAAIPAVIAAVVLWYLYQPNVKAAFGRG